MIVPSMTAKHFKFIAETLKDFTPQADDDNWHAMQAMLLDLHEHFSRALAATNSQFNREKFLEACNGKS